MTDQSKKEQAVTGLVEWLKPQSSGYLQIPAGSMKGCTGILEPYELK